MTEKDMLLDISHMPDYAEIDDYMAPPVRELWRELNNFIKERYKAEPRIMYSKCCAKPGWNMKYQKSGKSLCTLYPGKDSFVVLVVITLDLLPVIEALSEELTLQVRETIKGAKPFNGTLWLMLEVENGQALKDVKQLLLLKQDTKRTVSARKSSVI